MAQSEKTQLRREDLTDAEYARLSRLFAFIREINLKKRAAVKPAVQAAGKDETN